MSSRAYSLIATAALCCGACGTASSGSGGGGAFATPGCSTGTNQFSKTYVVNTVTLPQNGNQFSFDFNKDGIPENEFGSLLQSLASSGFDLQAETTASIAAGSSILLITQASQDATFQSAACAAASLQPGVATASPDFSGNGSFSLDASIAPAQVTGPIQAGAFSAAEGTVLLTNKLTVRLGLFNANIAIPLVDPQVRYTISSSGLASGSINGAILKNDINVIYAGLASGLNAQIAADPASSASTNTLKLFDTGGIAAAACGSTCQNPDGSCAVKDDKRIDACELSSNTTLSNLFAPDVQLFSGTAFSPGKAAPDSLSAGFGFTAVSAILH
jgi:hypothetical protein